MRKFALLVGVEEYEDKAISRLQYARADVLALGDRLKSRCSFDDVRMLADPAGLGSPRLVNVLGALCDLAGDLRPDDLFLFFFSGHGIEAGGQGYLLTPESSLAFPKLGSLPLSELQEAFGGLAASQRILLLDACRNDPDTKAKGDSGNRMTDGLSRDIVAVARAKTTAGMTTALFSACRSGQRAREWPQKGHGVFTHFLLEGIEGAAWKSGELEFEALAAHVHREVARWSKATPGIAEPQIPWYEKFGDPSPLILARGTRPEITAEPHRPEPPIVVSPPPPKASPPRSSLKAELALADVVDAIRKSNADRERQIALWTAFVEEYPIGQPAERANAEIARLRVEIRLEKEKAAFDQVEAAIKKSSADKKRQIALWAAFVEEYPSGEVANRAKAEIARLESMPESYVETHGGVNIEMVGIPGGTFQMGSNNKNDDEKPVHQVTLDGFWIGKYEVTQRQYEALMGTNPSNFKGPNRPVEMVSWNDAMEFCRKLSQLTGKSYTLPTEAQWEYACRAGSTTEYCFGDSESSLGDYAWYDKNSGGQTHDVGGKKPNAWGLYDMHGNVWEWCADWKADYSASSGQRNPAGPSSGSSRVLRGGDWSLDSRFCRSAFRDYYPPDFRDDLIGFRLARTQK